ncbi:MAG: acetate/propionate family kinase [Planctomycetales bacterium]|nr:acetate/propionate family kinase [Planctomycetales bacterium]MCA9202362.1 acetate/propionate family kinase [Planctomycetales bacterium]MCA9210542.1 acetate/propionate family kinase [Planctomycetales bacterium]
MKILVANLGSTSFKYRLFDMSAERQLARGGIERIGSPESQCFVEIGGRRQEMTAHIPDHAVAVEQCLAQLSAPDNGCLSDPSEVSAIGFKAVHGGRVSGVQRVTEDVLAAMEQMNQVAPAHNPPYIAAMRLLAERLPRIPLVAAFETGFHATVPDRLRYYAIPKEWGDRLHIKRWGFHGASHRYIGYRMAALLGREDARVISCHLGGSNSLCAIRGGQSVATSMGMSPQTGLPHNNRVGDFDPFALPVIMQATGKTLDEVLHDLAENSGLLGLSGVSGDVRDLEQAAATGNGNANLALDMFATEIRRHLGGMLVELGGADAIVFTGGIGENSVRIRSSVCHNLDGLGIILDPELNVAARGEMKISQSSSPTEIWIVPTNEELIVARQAKQLLEG